LQLAQRMPNESSCACGQQPAAGQFAQMIGNIAGIDVRQPPYEDLGRFTNPGSPEAILAW